MSFLLLLVTWAWELPMRIGLTNNILFCSVRRTRRLIKTTSTLAVINMGALFYSPVDFTDASDLHQSAQGWCISEINRWIKQRTLYFDHSGLFITLHNSCEDSLMRCVSAWPSAAINGGGRRLALGINVLNGRNFWRRSGAYAGFHFGRGWMASAGAQAYNGVLGAVPPAGSRGRAPGGDQGAKPPWSWKLFVVRRPKK